MDPSANEPTFEVQFSTGDIRSLGRLTRRGVLQREHPFVIDVRTAARDQQFDVEFEFRELYTVTTTPDHAQMFAKLLFWQQDSEDTADRATLFLREIIRATAARENARSHVAAIENISGLPDNSSVEAACNVYTVLAEEFQRACSLRGGEQENRVFLSDIQRRLEKVDESQVERLFHALGETGTNAHSPYLYNLYTPADDDPVNTPLRRGMSLGAIPAEP